MALLSATSAMVAPASMASCAEPLRPWKVKGTGRQLTSVSASVRLKVPRKATTIARAPWSNAM